MDNTHSINEAALRAAQAYIIELEGRVDSLEDENADLHIILQERDETVAAMYGDIVRMRQDRNFDSCYDEPQDVA